MAGLFEQLYKYKQLEKRNQKENFLTEILNYCLTNDLSFRNNFLHRINCEINYSVFHSQTQFVHIELGRPDLLITLDNHTKIIIECKVDSSQEITQLSRYKSILKNNGVTNSYLVFLTKYYEDTKEFIDDPCFIHIRWYHVYEDLKFTENIISKELSQYLITQNMDSQVNFNISDKTAISFISENIKNMDTLLFRLSGILERYSDGKIIYDKWTDLISSSQYGVRSETDYGLIWIGFYEYDNNDEMQLSISFSAPKKVELIGKVEKVLDLAIWKFYDWEGEDTREWYLNKGLSEFIKDGLFQIDEACDFIEVGLQFIKQIAE